VHRPARSARVVDAVAQRIIDDQIIDLELDRIDDLFTAPSIDPFDDRALPLNPGIEEIVATLCTLRRLPIALTVRIALPGAARAERPAADVEAAIHRRAQLLAVASQRDALAVRSQGRSQSPLGIVIGLVGGFSAYGLAYLAKQTHAAAAAVALLVVAALALAIGWIVGWVVLEAWILDWRPDARKADACELLADARVELVAIDAAVESRRRR
jgi:hypothetical protein